jgi:hypothetical protein
MLRMSRSLKKRIVKKGKIEGIHPPNQYGLRSKLKLPPNCSIFEDGSSDELRSLLN